MVNRKIIQLLKITDCLTLRYVSSKTTEKKLFFKAVNSLPDSNKFVEQIIKVIKHKHICSV